MNSNLLDDLNYNQPQKAGFALRLRATLLDLLMLLICASFLVLFLFILSYFMPFVTVNVGVVLLGVSGFLYSPLMESSKIQGSLGKQGLNLRVVDKDGKRIGFGRAVLRFLVKIVSLGLFFVGFVMIAFSEDKKGLHDIVTGTTVINLED